MTTVKRYACVVLLSLSLLLTASCARAVSDDALMALEKLQSEIGGYDVMIAQDADADTVAAATLMAESISDRTGYDCEVINDGEQSTSDVRFSVLVGETSREESRKALYGLKRDDYVCRLYGCTLVIGGKTGTANYEAVQRYIEEIFPLCEPTEIITDDCEFEYSCKYELEDILVDGVTLGGYTYVYTNESDSAVRDLAYSLRELVADKSGLYPNVTCADSPSDGKREVLLLVDGSKSGCYGISYDGEDVHITADTVYGLSVAIERFYQMIVVNSQGGVSRVELENSVEGTYSFCDPRVMLVSTRFDDSNDPYSDAQHLVDKISSSDRSIIALGPLDIEMWDAITHRLPDRFSFETVTLEDGHIVPVLFDTFELGVKLNGVELRDGVSVMTLELKTISGEDEMQFLLFFGKHASSEDVSFLKEKLTALDVPYVAALMMFDGTDETFDIARDGISVEYNSVVRSGDKLYRYAVFSQTRAVSCSDVEESVCDKTAARFVCADYQKRYCKEYSWLID